MNVERNEILKYASSDMKSALEVVRRMEKSERNIKTDTYAALACSYAIHGRVDDILSLLDRCKANDIFLTDTNLFDIIYELATNGHTDLVHKILPKLEKSAGYNQEAKKCILRLVNKGQVDLGYEMVKGMRWIPDDNDDIEPQGLFFVKRLVWSGDSLRKILDFSKELELDDTSAILVVEAFIDNNRSDEIVPFLNCVKTSGERSVDHNSTCRRILYKLAENGRPTDVEQVFSVMEKKRFIEANNYTLGALVAVHLANDDIGKAMVAFEAISIKYKCTPCRHILASKLIESDDTKNLQLFTSICTNVHGEVNSLYNLALAYLESGRIQEARTFFEKPSICGYPERIYDTSNFYRLSGKTTTLMAMVDVTKDLDHIDRHTIFYNLLLAYVKEGSANKALDLWTKIQKENVPTTSQFVNTLRTFLEKNNVPFVMPKDLKIIRTATPNRKTVNRNPFRPSK